jgi:uridylate kinase
MENSPYIVISLGGSLIVPNEIDTQLLKEFTTTIKEYVGKGFRFVIITGGGRIARNYTVSAKEITDVTNTDLDWVGIAVTRLNAELLRVLCVPFSHEKIVFDPQEIPQTDKPVLVGGGWKPGNSSDLAAVMAARSVGAQKVINLSNIDYVYNKDPRSNPDAIKIEHAHWSEFRALLPKDWDPGLNSPFDPIAAKEAEELGLEVAVLNGRNIENLKNYLDQKEFIGTVIK